MSFSGPLNNQHRKAAWKDMHPGAPPLRRRRKLEDVFENQDSETDKRLTQSVWYRCNCAECVSRRGVQLGSFARHARLMLLKKLWRRQHDRKSNPPTT